MNQRIAFCSNHTYGVHLLTRLLRRGVAIDQVVCQSAEQGKRHAVSGYADLAPLAESSSIPVYRPESFSLDTPKDLEFFRGRKFDLLIVGGWQRLIPDEVLRTLVVGAVGVHGSADYLPKGRGRSPLNWAIVNGDQRFILHLFHLTPGIDDGPVYDTEMFDVTSHDTVRTLYMKNVMASANMLERALPRILDGSARPWPQLGASTTLAKRSESDRTIDWEMMTVGQVDAVVRASTRPYPGARAVIAGENVIIWRAQVFDTRLTFRGSTYGEVVDSFGQHLVINCRGGLLLIEDYQRSNSGGAS